MQGDWDVGLVDDINTSTPPTDQTQACAPFLVVHPANLQPQERTIMIVGNTRIAATPARAWFIKLKGDDVCDSMINCDGLFNP